VRVDGDFLTEGICIRTGDDDFLVTIMTVPKEKLTREELKETFHTHNAAFEDSPNAPAKQTLTANSFKGIAHGMKSRLRLGQIGLFPAVTEKTGIANAGETEIKVGMPLVIGPKGMNH